MDNEEKMYNEFYIIPIWVIICLINTGGRAEIVHEIERYQNVVSFLSIISMDIYKPRGVDRLT